MKKCEKIPECFFKLYETTVALENAEYMKKALEQRAYFSIGPEMQFLDEQIEALKAQWQALSTNMENIIEPLAGKDNIAYLAIKFHYSRGITWEEIAAIFGDTRDALRHRAYRAIEKLL